MDRVWMITGAGRGLGRAFMKEAIANGDKVIATVRKMPENDDIINNTNVLPVVMDITDPDAVLAGVQLGVEKFGRIDVLINNAGFGMSSAFEEMTDKELRPFNIQVSAILPGSFRTDFRDSSSMKRAENSIAAYDGTSIREVSGFLL